MPSRAPVTPLESFGYHDITFTIILDWIVVRLIYCAIQ